MKIDLARILCGHVSLYRVAYRDDGDLDRVVSFDMLLGRERVDRLGKAMRAASLRLGVGKPSFCVCGPCYI